MKSRPPPRAVARVGRPSLAAKALDHWDGLALATRRELLAALASSPALAEPLIRALEQQVIAPGELDPTTREGLRHLADAALRSRALGPAGEVRATPAVEPSSPTTRPHSGSRVTPAAARPSSPRIARPATSIEGRGITFGPELSGIAGRAPEALLVDILDPNREVEPDYVVLAVATQRGQVLSGILAEETATAVKLHRAEGVEESLLRSEVDELRSTGQSLMPEGLEQSLGLQEMADLVAFLRGAS